MINLIKTISRQEWRFIILVSVVIIILTGLPYLTGYLMTPAGFIYDGLNSLTPGDNPIYYSYINQVKTGSILVKDLFTSENQPQGLLNVFWLFVGLVAKIFNFSPIFSFHLIRLLLIPIFVSVSYLFLSLIFYQSNLRRLSLIFLLFSAGLGAYIIAPLSIFDFSAKPGFGTPNDLWVPESITFLAIYKSPHFIASLILMISIFLLMILAIERKKFFYSIGAGFLALIYFNFHPFYIPLVFGSLGLYLFCLILKTKKILWREIIQFGFLILISSPSIFYHFWTLANSEVLRQRAWQNVTLSPSLTFIILGYGLLWLFAAFGLYGLTKKRQWTKPLIFCASLLFFSLFLVTLPIQFQSRYLQGLHLPLVVFSIHGLIFLKEKTLKDRFGLVFKKIWTNEFLLAAIFILFLAISNLFNLTRDFYYFLVQPVAVKKYFYLPKDLILAFEKLSELPNNSIILSDVETSLFIPGFSGQKVFVAHGIETIDYFSKKLYAGWFFAADENAEKKFEFLKKSGINYLLISQENKKIGGFAPETKIYLKLVYQNSQAKIYQVMAP